MHSSSLRSTLTDVGFTVDAIDALWGTEAAAALHRGHRLPAIRAIEGRTDPLAALARLLVLGIPVPAANLPELDGLVRIDGGIAHPLLDVRPYDFTDATGPASWFIASDLGETALGHKIPEGHVLGIGGASLTLSGLMIGRPVASVLDLGTGCGIQAMHAARHAARVVATDISARALELTALNLELNAIDGVELRLGSLYEPVAGERFDRIVSNPPFVITPRTEGVPSYEYRDGGMVGDALVEHVIRGAEDHLTSGGIAQLLGNWEYRDGVEGIDSGLDRVRDWVAQTGLDAWVVERELQDPALYAETWIRDGGTRPGTAEFERLYAAWLDDFEARGVTGIGFGYITLRRPLFPGTPRLRRVERITHALGSGLGSSIAASLDAWDWLSVRSDAELAAACLTVASDVTEERHYWPGDEHPAVITLRQGGGFAREVQAGTALAAVVGASDGELTIGQICDAVAQLLEVDGNELLVEIIAEVRELVFTGLLVP